MDIQQRINLAIIDLLDRLQLEFAVPVRYLRGEPDLPGARHARVAMPDRTAPVRG